MAPRPTLFVGVLLLLVLKASSCQAWVSPVVAAAARNNYDRVPTRLNAKSANKKKPKKKNVASTGGGFATKMPAQKGIPSTPNTLEKEEEQEAQHDGLESNQKHTDNNNNNNNNNNIVQLSSRPPIYTMDEFLDPQICASAITSQEALQEVGALLQQQIAARLFHNQTSVHDGLRYSTASYHPSGSADHDCRTPLFPDGLHMDTNNECIFRHVTCILYLNGVVHGGATWFPLAETSTSTPTTTSAKHNNNNQGLVVAASERLLAAKIGHTRSCGTVRRSGAVRQADGDLLEHCCCADDDDGDHHRVRGIKVQPQAGRLLVFFSRTATGEEDVRAWHGGERLLEGADDKHILTLFKQVDYGPAKYPSQAETTFEGYLAPQVTEQLGWFRTYSERKKYKIF